MLTRAALAWVAALAVATPAFTSPAFTSSERADCPSVLREATRLLLVTTPGMARSDARARLFVRPSVGPGWQAAGLAFPATVGRNGLGWAWNQTALSDGAEPVKREGDGRTPAGIFAAGVPFGASARPVAGYRLLDRPRTACVDDVRSPFYNALVDAALVAPGHGHEPMWRIPLYRQGIVVEHATSRPLAGGSCIFLHVWRAPGRPTSGCVAMAESNVIALQDAFDGRRAAIVILPQGAVGRLAACGLPVP